MSRATVTDNKKRAGRPPTGQGVLVGVRMQPDELELLDLWIAANAPGKSRPEALRRILRLVAMRVRKGDGNAK